VTIGTHMLGRRWTLADVHQQVKRDMHQLKDLRTWLRDEEATARVGSFGTRPGQVTLGGPGREERGEPRPARPYPGATGGPTPGYRYVTVVTAARMAVNAAQTPLRHRAPSRMYRAPRHRRRDGLALRAGTLGSGDKDISLCGALAWLG
jgi:hypothetical protein